MMNKQIKTIIVFWWYNNTNSNIDMFIVIYLSKHSRVHRMYAEGGEYESVGLRLTIIDLSQKL